MRAKENGWVFVTRAQKEIALNLAKMNSNSDIADGVPLESNLDDDVAIGRFVETGKPSMPKKAKLKKYIKNNLPS